MRLLFVADGRSPIALNWIRYFVERGHEVYLASTFACQPGLDLKGFDLTPVAFSGTKRPPASTTSRPASSRTLGMRTAIRHFLGPLTVARSARRLREVIRRAQPDLVHAMRIPYEGMLAADAYTGVPLLVSVWGNDFTLHAPSTPLMRHYTRWTMQAADALHADCQRDIRLAGEWGFEARKPSLVVPGGGGVRTDVFHPPDQPVEEPVIVNPRGFRAYVRNDAFFQAIPLVLEDIPQARFLCASMAGEAQAAQWIETLGVGHAVELLPPLPHEQMAAVFRRAAVLVSPSVHDGTPNSLLEGMACGCFPVAGDLESIREWITDGKNGLLTDATDPRSMADSILDALQNRTRREQAAQENPTTIRARAEYRACMAQVEAFYSGLMVRNGKQQVQR
jgi:glycosyltransferase involved in cell wall biosynthesis